MSEPRSTSPHGVGHVATTATYEEQVILDLQNRLTKLAQQNRASIAKALSATEASGKGSPSSQTSRPVTSQPVTVSEPALENASSELSSFPTLPTSSTLQGSTVAADTCMLHPLTRSQSSPAKYPSMVHVPLTELVVGQDQRHRHSTGEVSLMGQAKGVLQDTAQPERPLVSHLANGELLEKQLEDTKARVFHLDSKLKECNEICEQQKLHFKTAIVDLQTKLNNTIVGRNSVLELRRQEAESQEKLVNQLQMTFADVEVSNQQQAQVLQDASSKISSLYTELQSCNAALMQAITLAVGQATKRGLTLHHKTNYSGPVDSEQVIGVLTEVLEHFEKELDRMEQKAGKTEKKLAVAEEEFALKWQQNGEEQKQMLRKLREEQEAQLSAATERALNARKQTLSLQSQLTLMQEQMQKQLDTKTNHVTELQDTLRKAQEDAEVAANALQAKCDALSSELKTSQQQQRIIAEEKSQLQEQTNSLEHQLISAKESISKAEIDMGSMRLQNNRLSSLEEDSNVRLDDLMAQLAAKTRDCQQLNRLVGKVREETAREAEQRIAAAKENNRQCITSQTNDLTAQINGITQKYNTVLAELKHRKNELEEMQKSNDSLTRNLTVVSQDLQQLKLEKTAVVQAGEEKGREVENLRIAKEQLVVLDEERKREISSLQNARDQLQVQVNEKDEQCMRLQEQTSGMAQLAEVTRKASEDWKWERSQMNETLERQSKELQDLKMLQEGLNRKRKVREKRLRNVEEENKRLQEVVQGTTQESESVVRSKEELRSELQQTKMQLDLLTIENEKLKAEIMEKEQIHQKDINKHITKIQSLQRELHTAHTTIQARTTMDGKAVKVAENMQKELTAKRSEIDALQTEILWLKESLEIIQKEKTAVTYEREHYKAQVSEARRNNENLKKEQETIKIKRSEQSFLVAKLEDSLTKASVKHAECKAIIERQEQDMAMLKLKHQLELKELERAKIHLSPIASIPVDQLCALTEKTTSMANNVKSLPKKDNETQNILNKMKASEEVSTQTHAEATSHPKTASKMQHSIKEQQHVDPSQRWFPVTHGASVLDQDLAKTLHHQPQETLETSLTDKQALKNLLTEPELRKLLIEMYSVTTGRPRMPQSQNQNLKARRDLLTGIPSVSRNTTDESGYKSRQFRHTAFRFADETESPLLTSSPVRDQPPAPTRTDHNLSALSSVLGSSTSPRFNLIPEADFLQGPSSPVSSLLGVSRCSTDDNVYLINESSWNNNRQADPVVTIPFDETEKSNPTVIGVCDTKTETFPQYAQSARDVNTNAHQEQMRLLQDKLQRLNQLGAHLQKENKDVAVLIKRQGSQLRRCRKQEKRVQQLVSKPK